MESVGKDPLGLKHLAKKPLTYKLYKATNISFINEVIEYMNNINF